jgi:hypothetical protein
MASKKLFNNTKPMIVVIAIFAVLFLTLLAFKARSEELYVSGGSTVLKGETPTIGLSIAWKGAGPKNTDYEFGFNLIGESTYYKSNSNQIVLHAMLVDSWKKFELGFGFAYFNVPSEYACQKTFTILTRWRFSSRFHIQEQHFSSAGSCSPNLGRDLVTFGYRF